MLDILNSLSGQDLGFLKIVANAWGIEIKAPDAYKARQQLATAMDNPDLIKEMYETFPETTKKAFDFILENDGKIPWVKFIREFGDIQTMGAAKRDRERPDLHPKTPTEFLWYRAFIGRAFFSTENEPQEFVFVPEEIFNLLKPIQVLSEQIPGRLATEKEYQFRLPAMDRIIDDICTVLAASRNNFELEDIKGFLSIPLEFLREILRTLNLLSENEEINSELVRQHLELPRNEALLQIFLTWFKSSSLEELFFIPGLVLESKPDHNPVFARKFILDQISLIPTEKWWNLDSFISYIHQTNPDFQRPAGNYDSWYIKDKESDEFLNGFENWHKVDGAYIQFLITGPLYWLGLLEIGSNNEDSCPKSFKLSSWFPDLINNQTPIAIKPDETKISITSSGKITIPLRFLRPSRYQISRFCEWIKLDKDHFVFQITTHSLKTAKSQSLKISHFLRIIQPVLNHPFPPKLKNALENWENHGAQAFINHVVLLQVFSPDVLIDLQGSPVSKFIISVVNPTTAIINANGLEKIKQAMVELGYLIDLKIDEVDGIHS